MGRGNLQQLHARGLLRCALEVVALGDAAHPRARWGRPLAVIRAFEHNQSTDARVDVLVEWQGLFREGVRPAVVRAGHDKDRCAHVCAVRVCRRQGVQPRRKQHEGVYYGGCGPPVVGSQHTCATSHAVPTEHHLRTQKREGVLQIEWPHKRRLRFLDRVLVVSFVRTHAV